jgi:hypothetical protein
VVNMFWVNLVDNFQILIAFLLLHVNLILFFMLDHCRLGEGVSEDEASLVFNNVVRKVIKDAFKYARCIYVTSYYTQVNLLLFYMQMLKLLFFTLTCKCNSLFYAGVEDGDEAHPGPRDLCAQGAAPSGERRLIGKGSGGLGLALWLLGVRPV